MPVAPLDIKLPSAAEVIPIHTSDRQTFKFCRRRWDWSSPMRRNLVPNALQFPLWFGTGVHFALENHYADNYDKHPDFVNMRDFFDIWWVNQTIDPHFQMWLENADDEEREELAAHHVLGVGMCDNYQQFSVIADHFQVMATERDFSVPLGFDWYDVRTDQVLPVHYRGRLDMIVRDQNGRYWIVDHKTAARIDDDYFLKLDMDEQCGSYLWAAQKEAQEYDLPWKEIDGVIYNVMKKAVPESPPTTYQGKQLSMDRSNPTTPALFNMALDEHGLWPWFHGSEKAQAYYAFLEQEGWDMFFRRHPVRRNQHELTNIGLQICDEAWDMLSDPRIYPNPSGSYQCLRCAFRAPCLATNDGSDAEFMLEGNFHTNKDRGIQEATS